MTQDEFMGPFNDLVQAFGVPKPEERANVYYRHLQNMPVFAWKGISDQWVRTQSRFPTLANLIEAYSVVKQSAPRQKESCSVCDGNGWVRAGVKMYRGDCKHGEKLNKGIKVFCENNRYLELKNQQAEMEELYGDRARVTYPEIYVEKY